MRRVTCRRASHQPIIRSRHHSGSLAPGLRKVQRRSSPPDDRTLGQGPGEAEFPCMTTSVWIEPAASWVMMQLATVLSMTRTSFTVPENLKNSRKGVPAEDSGHRYVFPSMTRSSTLATCQPEEIASAGLELSVMLTFSIGSVASP